LEVVDVNHAHVLQHIETVEDILAEIDVPPVPRILVWNKIDQYRGDLPNVIDPDRYTDIVPISAVTGEGLDKLLSAIEKALTASLYTLKMRFPYDRGDLVSLLHDQATVEHQLHGADGIEVTVCAHTKSNHRGRREDAEAF